MIRSAYKGALFVFVVTVYIASGFGWMFRDQ
jgi:hypothetical protein